MNVLYLCQKSGVTHSNNMACIMELNGYNYLHGWDIWLCAIDGIVWRILQIELEEIVLIVSLQCLEVHAIGIQS